MTNVENRQSESGLDLSIHLLTCTGVLAGMAALVSVVDNSPRLAIVWLLVAQVIDGIDGPIARRWMSSPTIPRYDGYILDLVIDYVTCVLVPAFFLYRFEVLPHNAVGMFALAAVLGTSAMWFSRTSIETDDHWFKGFPAAWNMIVPTLYLVSHRTDINAVIVLVLCAMSMSDIEFPHVMKAKRFRPFTLIAMVLWCGAMLFDVYREPDVPEVGKWALLIGPAWLGFVVVMRSFDHRVDSSSR